MVKIRLLLAFGWILFIPVNGIAQELKCNVQVVSEQVQGTNKSVFETLQKAISEFVNNRNWTNNVFSNEERIECNMLFKITTYSAPDFSGTLQIQVRRPIFNSSYNSTLLNYLDQNIQFSYVEFQSLDFSETSFGSNLTSLLAFYCDLFVGIDYDTYSFKGGTEFFNKAEVIVNNAQNATETGWKPNDGTSNKNRYWLIQNILEDRYSPVREFLYKYHRLGLDIMYEKPSEGRDEIAEDLALLQQVYRDKPDPYMLLLQIIFNAKSDEFINVFSESYPEEKSRVTAILKEIDPSNLVKYQKILQ
jgi:hypothetical protein